MSYAKHLKGFLSSLYFAAAIGAAAGRSSAAPPPRGEGERDAAASRVALDQNKPELRLETKEMSNDTRQGYRLFRGKCGQCHSLNRLLKRSDLSEEEWSDIIFRMEDMASSHTNEAQSKEILKFVIWEDKQRKQEARSEKH